MIHDNITSVAALLGDPTRMAILIALFDGRALPAGELAKLSKVSPQTASAHLTKLLEGGLITVEVYVRHRYYRLAGPEVAKAIEALSTIAPPAPIRSLGQSNQAKALSFARTCYDHIAGEFGVAFTSALVRKGYIDETNEGYLLTSTGETWLREFGIDESKLRKAHPVVPWHVDWTERLHHIAGPLSVAITHRMLELGWITHGKIRRSIVVTELGYMVLQREFGLIKTEK